MAVWVVSMALAWMTGCSRTPDEQRVREAVDAAVAAAEDVDAGAFGKWLTDDFDGNRGTLDRRGLVGMLRLMRLRGEHLNVLTGPVSVQARGERYVATFTVTLGAGNSRWLPDRLGVYHVTTAWRRDGRRWRCYRATWTR